MCPLKAGGAVKVSEELGEALADLCRFLKIDLDKLSLMINDDIVMMTMAIHSRD